MRLVTAFSIMLAIGACDSSAVPHSAILGKWKSNEELTLKSMNAVVGMNEEVREYFENNLFGHLQVEWLKEKSRAVNEIDDFDIGYVPYEVLEVDSKFIRVREWSSFLNDYDESTLYLDGDCYYVITTKYEFREYFCRQG